MSQLITYVTSHKIALALAFLYVGYGTLAVCSVYPSDLFHGEWAGWSVIPTFPVTIISFGLRFADGHTLYPVFIVQSIMFVAWFYILSSFIRDKKRNFNPEK